MKRLLFACLLMIGFAGIAGAQTTATPDKKKTTVKSKIDKVDKKTTTAEKSSSKITTIPSAKTSNGTAATTTKPATKMKANGTPDMRYKANKEVAKAAGPKKKNGEPDMRYKVNKQKQKAKE
jgi:hypothetical protein